MLHFGSILLVLATSVGAYDSGEYYHSHFVPFHSIEERDFTDHHHHHHPQPANYKCFGYHNYPVLNNYPIHPAPAPPAPFIEDLDPLFVAHEMRTRKKPQSRYYSLFDDGFDDSDEAPVMKKKIPFDVCYEMCPSPKDEKLVCGNDGKTYTNIHRLNCAVRCGIDVKFKAMGDCYTGKVQTGDDFDFRKQIDIEADGASASDENWSY